MLCASLARYPVVHLIDQQYFELFRDERDHASTVAAANAACLSGTKVRTVATGARLSGYPDAG